MSESADTVKNKSSAYPPWQKATVGRPTRYNPKYCQEILDYFFIPATKEVENWSATKNGTERKNIHVMPTEFPTLEGFACQIGVCVQLLYDWEDKYPEFHEAMTHARQKQKDLLIKNGIAGYFNPTFAGLAAKNIIGWSDKTEHEITGKDGTPLIQRSLSPEEEAVLQQIALELQNRKAIEGEVIEEE